MILGSFIPGIKGIKKEEPNLERIHEFRLNLTTEFRYGFKWGIAALVSEHGPNVDTALFGRCRQVVAVKWFSRRFFSISLLCPSILFLFFSVMFFIRKNIQQNVIKNENVRVIVHDVRLPLWFRHLAHYFVSETSSEDKKSLSMMEKRVVLNCWWFRTNTRGLVM
jgi:hypothetical protein